MFARLINGIAALLGAAVFAQFPAFYQQYLQRLGGRLDQVRHDVDRLMQDVATFGRGLQAYIEELLASGTEAARLAAQRELERLDRASELETAYAALREAEPLERPIAFLENLDPALAQDTLRAFEPAVPVTFEGLLYAATGLVFGLALLIGAERLGGAIIGRIGRHRRATADNEATHA